VSIEQQALKLAQQVGRQFLLDHESSVLIRARRQVRSESAGRGERAQ
jgi:hypothetical protein